MRIILNINVNLLNRVKIIMQELKKDEYKSLLEIYSLKEILIVLLVKRLDNTYSLDDILKLFNIKSIELYNITSQMLKLLKYQENNSFLRFSDSILDTKIKEIK